MSLTILLFLAFSLLLLVFSWRNRYLALFAVLVVSMTISMFTLTVEVSRVSNYLVPSNYLIRPLETRMYNMIHSLMVIPLSTMMKLRNGGIVAYFGGIVCFVFSFYTGLRLDDRSSVRHFRPWYIPLIGLPVLFYVMYHPQTAYQIFRLYHSMDPGSRIAAARLLEAADTVMKCLVIIYLLCPILFLLIGYRRGRITLLSDFLLRVAGALLLLNVTFFTLFFTGVFRVSCADALQFGFWRFTLPTQIPMFYTSILPIVSFLLLVSVFGILVRLHADHFFSFFKSRGIRKNLNALYANVRNVLHSEKSLLFTIRILAQDALDQEDEAERRAKIRKILDLCSQNMDDMTRTLNDAHDLNMSTMRNDFIQAIETALSNQQIPDNILITRSYPGDSLPLFFDMYHMTHAISNILSNSLDALAAAQPERPEIRLTVYTSRNWVYFSVWDNGCGIPRKILRKVEQPYVSTKKKKNSWGIGLSYVFSVTRAHYGQMRVSSRDQEHTLVELLLPREKKGGKR